jgi:hypothetical protein
MCCTNWKKNWIIARRGCSAPTAGAKPSRPPNTVFAALIKEDKMKKNLPSMLFAAVAPVAVSLLLAFSNAAQATSAQDSWWIPGESGWGLNVLQEGGTFGMAMYVYDNNSLPVWYLGSGGGSLSGGFGGTMYTYRGPYFGAVFNPGAVSATPVGNFTFRLTAVNSAEFQYTINGVTVTKTVQRLGVAAANMTGAYTGAMVYRIFNCNSGSPQSYVDNANFTVAQNGASVTIASTFPVAGGSCTHTGNYAQDGRYGRISGNYTCAGGASGTFEMFEIESGSQSFSGRYTGTVVSGALRCSQEGRMGGVNTASTNY